MNKHQPKTTSAQSNLPVNKSKHHAKVDTLQEKPVEVGGPKGPEPTRYGDWEKAGRCSDF